MNDQDLLRYSRHILLNEFGIEAQEKCALSHALVVGAGGLGSAALLYLASAGFGRITVSDGDVVDLTNLQRQIIHRESSVGVNKAASAARAMREINSTMSIDVVAERLTETTLSAHVERADVVLDCTDNFATRHAINRACVQHRKPLVSGAAIRFDGQITSFDLRGGDNNNNDNDNVGARVSACVGACVGACYNCLFPQDRNQPNADEERCAVMGVFAPLVGMIGAIQAAEAIKLVTGLGEPLVGKLQMLDARTMEWQTVKYRRDPACVVCHANHHQRADKNGNKNLVEKEYETN